MRKSGESLWGQRGLTARGQETVSRPGRRTESAAVEALRSLEMDSHGEGQLRRGGGAGQEAAGRAQTQSDEPFFGRLVG